MAGGLTRRVNALVAQACGLSSSPHKIKAYGENQLPKVVFRPPQCAHGIRVSPCLCVCVSGFLWACFCCLPVLFIETRCPCKTKAGLELAMLTRLASHFQSLPSTCWGYSINKIIIYILGDAELTWSQF